MKCRRLTRIQAFVLLAVLSIPVGLAAQDKKDHDQHHSYELIDVGTLGGPNSYFIFGVGINKHGTVVGFADTSIPDPFAPNCFIDCFVNHAFKWEQGVLTDLGALTPGVSSGAGLINKSGLVAGLSQNGVIDPLTGIPELFATVWQNGQVINLGTFGGNNSYSNDLNDAGQAVGFGATTTPDSFNLGDFCFFGPLPTQILAFIWQNGVMQNLGTLGGPDSCALMINDKGQVAGNSFTNSTPNPVTGTPTLDPFLWEHGHIIDLGTLGGTQGYLGNMITLNSHGEVVGQSNLAGDLTFHPFRWTKSTGMQDLGTLGGDNGAAMAINDAGEIVGVADVTGTQIHHAFLWTKEAGIRDLGTQDRDPCGWAQAVNKSGQIVGGTQSDCINFSHAFLWEDGGPMIDLNTFVPAGSDLTLTEAVLITDSGEIAVQAALPNGDQHAVLLIPCDEHHDDSDCKDGSDSVRPVPQVSPVSRDVFSTTRSLFPPSQTSRLRFPGRALGPAN